MQRIGRRRNTPFICGKQTKPQSEGDLLEVKI